MATLDFSIFLEWVVPGRITDEDRTADSYLASSADSLLSWSFSYSTMLRSSSSLRWSVSISSAWDCTFCSYTSYNWLRVLLNLFNLSVKLDCFKNFPFSIDSNREDEGLVFWLCFGGVIMLLISRGY